MSEDIEINNYDNIEDFKDVLDKLVKDDNNYNENISHISFIFNLIPEIDATLILQLRREIKSRTGIILREIDEIIKEWKARKKAEDQNQNNSNNLNNQNIAENTSLENYNTPDNEIIPFDDDNIVITNDKILFFKKMGSDLFKQNTICDFKLDVISKVIDTRRDEKVFKFIVEDIEYPSYSINGIIKELGKRILGGTKGDNVITHLIEEKSKFIPIKNARYITGWNDGWYLPMDEEDKGFTIIHYSEDQRSTWNNCKDMYNEYTDEEKEALKNKLFEFVNITAMPNTYKAITIGLALMAPFRLYFIKKFGVFPHVALWGITTAGKTHWLDFWTTHFTKHRLNHMSGKTASSATRIESAMTGFTGAVMIDEYRLKNSNEVVDMEMVLKESATGVSNRKRFRRDGINFVDNREIVSSIFTTSQALGDLFLESALMARTVSLCYDESISPNDEWIKLELELIKERLFSLLYDYTKNWSDKELDKLMVKVEKHKSLENIEKNTIDLLYPKLLKIYQIIIAGCMLAKKIYGIKVSIKEVLETLKTARRSVVKEFVEIFLCYCNWAIDLEPNNPKPSYLSMKMDYNEKNKVFVLSYPCLRDWNKVYTGFNNDNIKFKLTTLFERIYQALENKDLVKLDYIWHNMKNTKAIQISPILIYNGDKEPTDSATNVAHSIALSRLGLGEQSQENGLSNNDFDKLQIEEDPEIYDPATDNIEFED